MAHGNGLTNLWDDVRGDGAVTMPAARCGRPGDQLCSAKFYSRRRGRDEWEDLMPLLTGSWRIVADGHEGTLTIAGVSSIGQLQFGLSMPTLLGSAGGLPSFVGFWDESSQTITFQHVVPDITPNNVPIPRISLTFTGHLFKAPVQPEPGQDVTWTLAGSFLAFHGQATTLSTSRRNRFGWVATISQSL